MEKKEVMIYSVMIAFGVFIIPIFIKIAWIKNIRPIGYLIMFIGVLYYVAGDQISALFNKKYSKLSSTEIIEKSKLKHQTELNKLDNQIEVETKRKQLNKLKSESKQTSKMPDVLGNISGYIDGDKKEKKKDNDLRDLF